MFMKKLMAVLPAAMTALGLIACSADAALTEEADSAAIRFSSAVGARSVTTEDLDQFSVWGFCRPANETGAWSEVFTQTPVTVTNEGGLWSYGYTEYWKMGYTYRFHAFYPIGQADETTVGAESGPSVTDFDSTNHIDLLYAVQERDYDTQGGSAVALNFRHLLSKVTFVGKADPSLATDGIAVTLTSVKLYGATLSKKGSWRADTNRWTSDAAGTAIETPYAERTERIPLSDTETDLFPSDIELLIIPQTSLQNVYFRIAYEYSGADIATTSGAGIINLGSILNASTSWEAGKSYKYRFTVGATDYILFDAPTVEQWKPNEIGGDSAIDHGQNQGN